MIKLYTKKNCPKCEDIKSFLEKTELNYQIIDITRDIDMLNELREVGAGAGFPVMAINNSYHFLSLDKNIFKDIFGYICGDTERMKKTIISIEEGLKIDNTHEVSKVSYDWGV